MNWIVHIITGYFATALFIPHAKELFMPIIIFSVIIDVDHWLPFARILLKREKNIWNYYKSAEIVEVRSVLHEFPATIAFVIIVLILSMAGFHKEVLTVAAICVPTHFIVDLLTAHTKPLRPFSNKTFFLGWYKTPRQGTIFEVTVTLITLVLYFAFV